MAAIKTVAAKRGKFAGITIYEVPDTVTLFDDSAKFISALENGGRRTDTTLREWPCDTVSMHPGGMITQADGPNPFAGYMTKDAYISLLRSLNIPLHLVSALSKPLVANIINERLKQLSIRTLYVQVVDKDCISHIGFVNTARIYSDEHGPAEIPYNTYRFLEQLPVKYFIAGGIDAQSSVILLANPGNKDYMVEVICSDTLGMKPRATPGVVNSKDRSIPRYPPRKAIFPSKSLKISQSNCRLAVKTITDYLDGPIARDLESLKTQFEKLDDIKVNSELRVRALAREMLGLKLGDGAIATYGSKALKEPLETLRTSQAPSMLKRRMVPNFMGRLVLLSMV